LLICNLTSSHITNVTNVSRTPLLNLQTVNSDVEALRSLGAPYASGLAVRF